MKDIILNLLFKVFIIVTVPLAIIELLFKNLKYCVKLFWGDLVHEYKEFIKYMKWGVCKEIKEREEILKSYMSNKKEDR